VNLAAALDHQRTGRVWDRRALQAIVTGAVVRDTNPPPRKRGCGWLTSGYRLDMRRGAMCMVSAGEISETPRTIGDSGASCDAQPGQSNPPGAVILCAKR
jgi:hypothetical protein